MEGCVCGRGQGKGGAMATVWVDSGMEDDKMGPHTSCACLRACQGLDQGHASKVLWAQS